MSVEEITVVPPAWECGCGHGPALSAYFAAPDDRIDRVGIETLNTGPLGTVVTEVDCWPQNPDPGITPTAIAMMLGTCA